MQVRRRTLRVASLGLLMSITPLAALAADAPVAQPSTVAPWLPLTTPTAGLRLLPTASPALRARVRTVGWPLSEPSGLWWRVPTDTAVHLANQPGVAGVWGLPERTPPPDDADLQPTTPDLSLIHISEPTRPY